MLSLSGLESVSPVESTPTITPGTLTPATDAAPGTGFGAILSKYSLSARTGEEAMGDSPGIGPLMSKSGPSSEGQLLPLLRQTNGEVTDGAAEQMVQELSLQLDSLTETIDQLLAQEDDGEGALSQFLTQELGLSEAEVDQVIQTLQNWADQPPEVAITPEQLEQLPPEVMTRLEGLTQVLDDLDQALTEWLAQVDPSSSPPVDPSTARVEASPGAPLNDLAKVFPEELRRLADSQSSPAKEPRTPAQIIAHTLQTVQNSVTNGSLPASPDLSRPEWSLLTTPAANQPAHDVAFNNDLVTMARATLNRKADAQADPSINLSSLTETVETGVTDNRSLNARLEPSQLERGLMRSLERPVQAQDVGRQLGERVLMMARGEIKQASIRLDPPELGMMDIKISVQNDQTQVQIVVQSPQVREALESQSSRLREILEQQGLSLSDLDVRDESRGQDGQGDTDSGGGSGDSGQSQDWAEEGAEPVQQWRQGLVDDFV